MTHLVNALLSVLVVTGLLAGPSLRPRLALFLGGTGSVVANHLVWLVAPDLWSRALTPWVASVGGALVAVAAWSLLRTSPTAANLVDPQVAVSGDVADDATEQEDQAPSGVGAHGVAMGAPAPSSATPGPVRRLAV
ncbi:hypothetical protein [Curtobacterium sp. MCBD17_023]|uniref:hypothetical protein n=1 Tax=Curtobacterium sp. MCBD17_023 TaxID=2175657 RepID=UPI000D863B81|nr:hypothetical protein [Curtobacterium sp. MCBD17_023]PYY49476.1 hypothetical protein DEI84_07220 [Curtobacterium sp. MCBD17_023]